MAFSYKDWYSKNKAQRKAWSKEYRRNNAEKIKAIKRKAQASMSEAQKEHHRARGRSYYKRNREKVIERTRLYASKNKDARRRYKRSWCKANRLKMNAYRNARLVSNPEFKLATYARNRISQFIRGKGILKPSKTLNLLGVTSFNFLKLHIESQFRKGMNWGNYGMFGWHVDHRIPLARFDLSDNEQMLKAFNYTNLQPLWAVDNLSKNARLIQPVEAVCQR